MYMNEKQIEERILSEERVYEGKLVKVNRLEVTLPDGKRAVREAVRHPGASAIVPVDGEGNVTLVRQYRAPIADVLLEIPAGKLDAGEDPATGALRELREEVGVVPGDFQPMGSFIAAPGCYGEILHLYLARDLKEVGQDLDPDEFLNVSRIPFDEMVRRCMNGEIQDAKTIIAVLKAKELLGL